MEKFKIILAYICFNLNHTFSLLINYDCFDFSESFCSKKSKRATEKKYFTSTTFSPTSSNFMLKESISNSFKTHVLIMVPL